MDENETVIDVTDETPETETENQFPWKPIMAAIVIGATSAVTVKAVKKHREKKAQAEAAGTPVEVVDGEILPPADLR